MTIFVFLGPTLPVAEARAELDAVYLPPVTQGDVLRAARERPTAIGIVDGSFERVPAVWHKEILWAMSQGIHVLGASSMGALRAAELSSFGMEGVGEVYEAFARGELEDDDEVAVAHADAEHGYAPLSEAMVDLRATLAAAAAAGVIEEGTRAALIGIAKALHYPDRAHRILFSRGRKDGLPEAEIARLERFWPGGKVRRKRLDALALLRRMRARFTGEVEPLAVSYRFQHTEAWEEARREAGRLAVERDRDGVSTAHLDALRRQGTLEAAQQGAMIRALALEIAAAYNVTFDDAALAATGSALAAERGLPAARDLPRWAEEQGVPDLARFLHDEARVRWARAMFASDAEAALADHLRVSTSPSGRGR